MHLFPKNIQKKISPLFLSLTRPQLLLGLLIIIIISYIHFILTHSVNIPIDDDYGQQFLVIEMAKAGDWIGAFFHAHNEHRPFTTYLFPLLTWIIFGSINIKVTVLVAGIVLLSLFFFLHFLKSTKAVNIITICLALLLFIPSGRDFIWAGGTLQYYSVLFFGFISIWLLQFSTWKSLVGSIFCYFLATFSMASGLLTGITAIVYLIAKNKFFPTKQLIAYLIVTPLFWYFHQSGTLGTTSHESSIILLLNNLIFAIKYGLLLTGNFLSDFFSVDQIILLAAIFHVAFIRTILASRKNLSLDDPLWFFLLYLILTCSAVLLGRIQPLSLELALAGRYQIYSSCYWAVALTILAKNRLLKVQVQHSIFGFLLFIYAYSYYNQSIHVGRYIHNITKNHELYLLFNDPLLLTFPDKNFAESSMKKAIDGGYYTMPKRIMTKFDTINQKSKNQHENYFGMLTSDSFRLLNPGQSEGNCVGFLDAKIDNSQENPKNRVLITGWVSPNPNEGILCDSVFLMLEISGQDTLYRKADLYYRPDVALHFSDKNMSKSGFKAIADLQEYSGRVYVQPICFTHGKYLTGNGEKPSVHLRAK